MYVENKDGLLDGERARIGWVEFSKTGRTIRYRGRSLIAIGGRGISGNFMDEESREEFWVSGVKAKGSNAHASAPVKIAVDEDAQEEWPEYVSCNQSAGESDGDICGFQPGVPHRGRDL